MHVLWDGCSLTISLLPRPMLIQNQINHNCVIMVMTVNVKNFQKILTLCLLKIFSLAEGSSHAVAYCRVQCRAKFFEQHSQQWSLVNYKWGIGVVMVTNYLTGLMLIGFQTTQPLNHLGRGSTLILEPKKCHFRLIALGFLGSNTQSACFMSPLRVTGDAVTGVAFHSTKRSSLNFQQLPRRNGSAFFKISKNRATSQGIPKSSKFFQLCSQKIQNFWLNGLHFGNSRGFLWNLERAYSLWCACGRQVKKQEVGQRTPPSLPL